MLFAGLGLGPLRPVLHRSVQGYPEGILQIQFTNPSSTKPAVGDLLILDAWRGNAYGHVAIVSAVHDDELEVIQQNTGSTRQQYDLDHDNGTWTIDNDRVLGRLRMP